MGNDDETPRSNRASRDGSLSLDQRLDGIEDDIQGLGKKLDKILSGMNEGDKRFTALEITVTSLSGRLTKLEESRDAVVKLIVFAVLIAMLGLIGLKVAG